MQAYLVAFTMPGGQYGLTYGSHVIMLGDLPPTLETVTDLQAIIAMEYDCERAIVINWDLLPDAANHPGVGPYCYFLTYTFIGEAGHGLGVITALFGQPISSLDNLREIEREITAAANVDSVQYEIRLLGCKPLFGASASLHEEYERTYGPENE